MLFNVYNTLCNLWSRQIDLPFEARQIELDPERQLESQLEEIFTEIKRIHAEDCELLQCIEKAYEGCKLLLEIAPLYDYDRDHQANGYWTFAKLIIKFGKVILVTSNEPVNFKRDQVVHVLQILNTGLSICIKIRNKETYGISKEDASEHQSVLGVHLFQPESLFSSKLDIVDLLSLVKSMKNQLTSLYAYFNSCWLSPSISGVMQYFSSFMAIYSSHWRSLKVYNWVSRHNRGIMFTNMSLNINIDCLQSMWNLTEYRMARAFMSISRTSYQAYSKSIYVPRQNRWKIDLFECKVYDQNAVAQQNSKHGDSELSKSVLIHIHGGGFISQSPEFHQSYLNDWCKQLKGLTILSIDYSLSPECAYPEALQQVLDCYLWLHSRQSQVQQFLGFYPEKVALCGDSAGGNLCMSLLLVLDHIHSSLSQSGQHINIVPYPEAIFCYYTPFLLSTIVSPSRLICSIEGLMPVGALLSCIAAYIPKEVMLQRVRACSGESTSKSSHCTSVNKYNSSSLLSLALDLYLKITTSLGNVLKVRRLVPWYNQTDTVKQSLYNLNTFALNPFISPLLAKNLENLKQIPLYLYPLTYDPFLDDSIEMAKKWKGKVHLEVIDGLPHGFLNLVKFSDKGKEASFKCMEHVRDVLS